MRSTPRRSACFGLSLCAGRPALLAAAALACAVSPSLAQLRVATWNISNYSGGRDADIKTVVYGQFQGRALAPDVLCGDEFVSAAAMDNFLSDLNTAVGSPGDWAAAPFIDGPDTDCVFFYRTSKVTYLATTIVAYGSSDTNNQPRNTYRYDLRPVGYGQTPGATLACYAVHMKAQGGTNDVNRRLIEAQRIRLNAAGHDATNLNGVVQPNTGLPAGWNFLVAGDMNAQSSTEPFYVEFTGSQPDNTGRFFDPINSPATWNNNGTYRYIHTQDPSGTGGMDDRHDQILVCSALVSNGGLASGLGLGYIGNSAIPFSTTTWNDPNHSYRCWGNDGTSFNLPLTTTGNTNCGAAVAQAIINTAVNGGHCPVYFDLRVPAKVASTAQIDFGTVPQNAAAQATLTVSNAGDTTLWTAAGIATVRYTLTASTGFTVPAGPFTDAPGGGVNTHTVTMNTSTPGDYSGTITITSNDPDQPTRVVSLVGHVAGGPPACSADWDHDGHITPADIAAFVNDWSGSLALGSLGADFDGDHAITPADVAVFVNAWFAQLSGAC